MLKKEIYKLANHKLLEELRVDVGKIQLKNDLTSSALFTNEFFTKTSISNREDIILCGESFIVNFLKEKFPSLKCVF